MQRSYTRSFKQHILRQARIRRKVAIAETGKGLFFCRQHSVQKQKGKWRNSIRISTLVARRTPAGEKRGRAKQKGRQGILRGEAFAHWIAIKYLYLYLHFKSAPVPASRVIVGHARRAYPNFSSII